MHIIEHRREEQLDALRATVTDISAELELPTLLSAILERATTLLNATGGDLGLYDKDKEEIHVVASYNMGKDYTGTRMKIGEGAMGRAVQTRQPTIIQNYPNWENASKQYKEGPWHAVLAVPFLIGERLIGVIGIVDANPDRRFTSSNQHLLSLFAQHAAIAVDNAYLYESARESAERRAILHKASQDVVAVSLDPEGIYTAIHNAASQLMPAEAFAITRFDEIRQVIDGVYLIDRSGRAPPQVIHASHGLSGRIMATGQAIYIPETRDKEILGDVVHFGDPESVRSVLAVPMRLGDKTIGMLSAQSYHPDAYRPDDKDLLEMLASYAAIALENARLFADLQRLAITDSVTEVYNRRHLFELGQREFHRAIRYNRPLSLIMLDVDNFKQVNDSFGHATGDNALHEFAHLLKANAREIDILGRYGGDEFTIILPETDLVDACKMAERIRKCISDSFSEGDSRFSLITVSIGVATMVPGLSNFTSLVNLADAAMLEAKHTGKNRVIVG